ncbi:MAG: sugar ABC transporter permease [bacterium]|nr:sugar ABC transporter permease [bacterium]
MVAQAQDRPNSAALFPALLIALLFFLLGVGAFGVVVSNVVTTIRSSVEGEAFGTTLLRFLNTYGIIFPILLVVVGIILVRFGIGLFQQQARAASWARQILLWLIVVCAVLFVQSFNAGASGIDGSMGRGIETALPFLLAAAVLGTALWWMGANPHVYRGSETLAEASSRTAWNLLLPTMAILVLVAMRPLEATFVTSLTDRTFASTQQTNFIGFENYARLLGLRVDTIPCERGDAGACALNSDGSIDFPTERNYFADVGDTSYRELGYDDIIRIQFGENRLSVSARDNQFYEAIGNTLTFTVFSVTLELLLGLGIALVINSKFAGRGLLRTAMLVPWAIPTVVSARLWEIMLRDNQSGVVNHFFTQVIPLFSTSQAWLAAPELQIPALVLIDVWKTTPFMALILLAGLQVIPSDIYEAADVDGANKVRQFFSLTLPLLRPTIAVALVFRTLDAVRVFDVFQVLLGDRRFSLATYNYNTLILDRDAGYASAIGVVIFVIILLFTVAYVRILGVSAE